VSYYVLSTLHTGERDSLLTVGIGAVPSNASSGLCDPTLPRGAGTIYQQSANWNGKTKMEHNVQR